jgi:hypothetical protein
MSICLAVDVMSQNFRVWAEASPRYKLINIFFLRWMRYNAVQT